MKRQVKYNIYPSLLDSYQNYLSSEETWLKYWGNSENPSKTIEEFEVEQFQGLIDKINRVPMLWEDSEKADRGTVFGEIVDCMIANRKSDMMQIERVYETYKSDERGDVNGSGVEENIQTNKVIGLKAIYNEREFTFPIHICREFAAYFKGAESQVRVSATLPTKYGNVEVYGVIDELMPTCVHDIKTTGSAYEAWKFKNSAQRLIYPYCLNEAGSNVKKFEFNILYIKELKRGNVYETITEFYNYNHDTDTEVLKTKVEEFIEFLEDNRSLITDTKIFNL